MAIVPANPARRRRRWLIGLLSCLLLLLGALWVVRSYGVIASGFFAKGLCSGVFVSGRDAGAVVEQDLRVYPPSWVFGSIRWSIDMGGRRVDAWLAPMFGSATALHRQAQGCALFHDPAALAQAMAHEAARPAANAAGAMNTRSFVPAWPVAPDSKPMELDEQRALRLQKALANGFAEDPARGARRTRAIVVAYRGQIVAEQYATGFGPLTPMPGWSMAKSVTAAWLGTLVQQGRVSIDEPLRLFAWAEPNDPRAALTFRHLLAMASGLAFKEVYDSPLSDVNRMLFFSADTGRYAARSKPIVPPDTVFNYSSGTTNLISLALRERLGEDYHLTIQRHLFEALGMRQVVMEADAAGTLVGSSYLFATAPDWARFGQLFLNDGVWDGRRVLPAGWAAYSATRSSVSEVYGAHWWLHEPSAKTDKSLPADLFQATGHAGQRVTVIPSKQLVIVRLGLTLTPGALQHVELVRDVIAALEP